MTISPSEYARWRASPMGATTEALEQSVVFDLAGPLSRKRLLDVGCGDGAYGIEAARRGAVVTGVDRSTDMLDAVRRRADEAGVRVELKVGEANELPFDDGTFDAVLAVTVLCFMLDAERAVSEMARVLAPGGYLVLGELGRRSMWAAWRRVRGWLGSTRWRSATFRSVQDLRRLVERANLRVERVRGSVYFPPVPGLASWMAPWEPRLSAATTFGAAFVAVRAMKRD